MALWVHGRMQKRDDDHSVALDAIVEAVGKTFHKIPSRVAMYGGAGLRELEDSRNRSVDSLDEGLAN
jgi:hypothetical protein